MSNIERFVPTGEFSLISDAPGWSSGDVSKNKETTNKDAHHGPSCWKCKGKGVLVVKVKNKKKQHEMKKRKFENGPKSSIEKCNVCSGNGFLPKKKQEMLSLQSQPGMITRKRRCPKDWTFSGPSAVAVLEMERMINDMEDDCIHHPLMLLHQAMKNDVKDEGICISKDIQMLDSYPWLPIHNGEQLCNLVGNWRILQKRASHRWTTDDICTAYVAIQEQRKKSIASDSNGTMRYLDLGCGNASVLQMTSWGLLEHYQTSFQAFGIEARSEAMSLARRSLHFNIGRRDENNANHRMISVLHGDFRDLESEQPFQNTSSSHNNNLEDVTKFQECLKQKFHLITGTPPYFRVDFGTTESNESNDRIVTSAIINQGGMPSSIQSAPARCEFRGGIEAYCKAASIALAENGIFVVCENWLNNDRVYTGASLAGLHIQKVIPFKGKESNPILFGVYVLKKKKKEDSEESLEPTIVEKPVSVRTANGTWTDSYCDILEFMSIPTKPS